MRSVKLPGLVDLQFANNIRNRKKKYRDVPVGTLAHTRVADFAFPHFVHFDVSSSSCILNLQMLRQM